MHEFPRGGERRHDFPILGGIAVAPFRSEDVEFCQGYTCFGGRCWERLADAVVFDVVLLIQPYRSLADGVVAVEFAMLGFGVGSPVIDERWE